MSILSSNQAKPPPARLAHTYKQAGELLGVSDRTVWTWVNEGRLKAMRIGRTVRISTVAIEQFIRENEIAGTLPEGAGDGQ